MAINKNGQVISNLFSNYTATINPFFIGIIEPDGSKWLQVLHHNNPATYKFNSTDDYENGFYTDINRWTQFNLFDICSKWEILVKQKASSTATEQKFRWIQTKNPNIATFDDTKAANITFIATEGYTTPGSSYGGAYNKPDTRTKLNCNNGTSSSWWGSWGCWTAYQGGIPGYNDTVVTDGYIKVYIRIDNDSLSLENKAKIYKTKISANDFWEI